MNTVFISTALLIFIAAALITAKKPQNYKANFLLAGAYICMACVLCYSLIVSETGTMPRLLVHSDLIFFYFTYPLLYLYVVTTTGLPLSFGRKHAIHLLTIVPGLANYIYYQVHGPEKERDVTELLSGTHAGMVIHLLGLIILLVYLIQSFRLIVAYNYKIETRPYAKEREQISWLKTLFPLFMVPCFLQFVSVAGVHLPNDVSLIKDCVLCLMIVFLLLMQIRSWDLFIKAEQQKKTSNTSKLQYYNNEELSRYKERLFTTMITDKAFRDANLCIDSLAKKMNLPSRQLSHLIKEVEGKYYTEYVMECRINYAIEIIADPIKGKWNSLAIASDCGFSSREDFSRCFKKVMGESFDKYVRKRAKSAS
jgi:AraC-like DNA-binding protein